MKVTKSKPCESGDGIVENNVAILEHQSKSKLNASNKQTLPRSREMQTMLNNGPCKENKNDVLNSKDKGIEEISIHEDPDKSGVVVETEISSSLTLHTNSQRSLDHQSLLSNARCR